MPERRCGVRIDADSEIAYGDRAGTTAEHFAKIAHKNHRHSVNNPYSQFRDEYSLEQVKGSREIYAPLTKLQCCPTSDGSAAAVIASEDFVVRHGLQGQVRPPRVLPIAHRTG